MVEGNAQLIDAKGGSHRNLQTNGHFLPCAMKTTKCTCFFLNARNLPVIFLFVQQTWLSKQLVSGPKCSSGATATFILLMSITTCTRAMVRNADPVRSESSAQCKDFRGTLLSTNTVVKKSKKKCHGQALTIKSVADRPFFSAGFRFQKERGSTWICAPSCCRPANGGGGVYRAMGGQN